MRILFITRHFGCLRNFEGALKELAARGHDLHLAALQEESQGGFDLVTRLAESTPRVTVGWTPSVETQHERDLARHIRLALDYLRYLEPAYDNTPRLKARAEERTPSGLLSLLKVPGMKSGPARRAIASALRRIEDTAPKNVAVTEYLQAQAPDIVLFTPLIGLGTPEVEYLSAARELGLRTIFCVWSWDNLSSKSLLRDLPDAVTVWNETQRREAAELHAVPRDRVIVTGAQCFDHWFGREPSRSRDVFCREVGLAPDRRFILYVCSALFRGSPSEADFVRQWLTALRQSGDPSVADLPVLVRPHPSRRHEWDDWDPTAFTDVVIWGSNPITPGARDDYFDSLFHSAVVVGLNTSAMLEAGILGKPVFTVMLPEYADNQEGTLHFHYLLDPEHGLLHASRSLPDHVRELSRVIGDPAKAGERSRAFVSHFLRPCGLEASGTSRYVEAVESVLGAPPLPPVVRSGGPVAQRVVRALEHAFERPPMRLWLLGPREREQRERRDLHHRAKYERKLEHQRAREAAAAEKAKKIAARQGGKARKQEQERRAARAAALRKAVASRLRRFTGGQS